MRNGFRAHGIRIRRLRLHADGRPYDVDFRLGDVPRPLSVIAGAFGTGKTTILEFVDYCLGAADHPRHPEIMPRVRAATLEVELSGTPHLIQRPVGEPSAHAYVSQGRLDDPGTATPQRRQLRPAGDPASLSSLLLSHCKLEGVRLRDGHEGAATDTDPLSFRDLMWLCFLPHDRLDSRDLLFENVPMKQLKLRQVVDVVFDVHDDRAIELGRRIRTLEPQLAAAEERQRTEASIVAELAPGEVADLEETAHAAKTELADAAQAVAALDGRARADTTFAEDLRERHHAASGAAHHASGLLRDRETQAARMTSLRATYADDVAKLVMLTEAGALFPPLRLDVCPSCLNPAVPGERRCATCQADLDADGLGPPDVSGELRAARSRLAELTRYLDRLEAEIPRLRAAAERAQEAESRAAADLDAATAHAVTPYLAQRDTLARRREEAAATLQRAEDGLRLRHGLRERATGVESLRAQLAGLREEAGAPDRVAAAESRAAVIAEISGRYRDILREWRYPRADDARVADDLTPWARGKAYPAASSGGRTLIALAWQLALFETAWESRSSHPGFLLLDSPQKNLGPKEVDRLYRHLERWLAGAGAGAQVIVTDTAPPATADSDVVVRFSRRVDRPPYALIDDETD
ncbi:DNA repair exonuclease SbcCD ATPase subunit [Catenuloplanes nepalensis]|uniref:DNA repair exonuclease SbcCD ATPase subunit n=1 Tax=Catenuloplanes nepalensis TaxID=587533 RepID=A0ABT9MZS5_9ACTN|nr:ATP-binding protein [Catenuloplanes nepalensis]MDP9796909.1 DNA repair exonuclease SbcCD ATPase subunit [Catenuloplanes nepalensis]